MRVCIHRGTHEIGGTCVEIESQGQRIVLDVGLPLDADPVTAKVPAIPGFSKPDPSLLGVFISHPHMDHYGLATKVHRQVPFYIGEAAHRILKTASFFIRGLPTFDNVTYIQHRKPMAVGPFTVTPYLVDHSAYDAYAFLVEADNRRLFYSGDLRSHGRKAKLFEQLIARPPKNVDVLLLEGTTLGRPEEPSDYPTESDLEKRFAELMRQTAGLVLVCCSGQNIDRLVTVYRAAKQSGRQFIVDLYTACILRSIGNPRLPQPGWPGVRVFATRQQRIAIKRAGRFDLINPIAQSRLYPEELAKQAHQSVMIFRGSMVRDLERAKCLSEASAVYSQWSGYLQSPSGADVVAWFARHGIPWMQCHTSGHAPVADLRQFVSALTPRLVVPIHSAFPSLLARWFPGARVRHDGRYWEVP